MPGIVDEATLEALRGLMSLKIGQTCLSACGQGRTECMYVMDESVQDIIPAWERLIVVSRNDILVSSSPVEIQVDIH